jgi:hypothetical protein
MTATFTFQERVEQLDGLFSDVKTWLFYFRQWMWNCLEGRAITLQNKPTLWPVPDLIEYIQENHCCPFDQLRARSHTTWRFDLLT